MEKWSRKKIKMIAKSRINANYWKSVLVAAILIFLAGVGGMSASNAGGNRSEEKVQNSSIEMFQNGSTEAIQAAEEIRQTEEYGKNTRAILGTVSILFLVSVVCCIAVLVSTFLVNPLIVGCARFFYKNLNEKAEVKEICYPFDRGYKNTVKAMFFRDLYTVLWLLLLIIPGIIKSYEYTLIPYLLAENENMTKEQAFAESKRLMKGNKWRAFVLDLSLSLWILLSTVSFGLVGVFYAYPYFNSIGAVFYEAVKEEDLFRTMEIEA